MDSVCVGYWRPVQPFCTLFISQTLCFSGTLDLIVLYTPVPAVHHLPSPIVSPLFTVWLLDLVALENVLDCLCTSLWPKGHVPLPLDCGVSFLPVDPSCVRCSCQNKPLSQSCMNVWTVCIRTCLANDFSITLKEGNMELATQDHWSSALKEPSELSRPEVKIMKWDDWLWKYHTKDDHLRRDNRWQSAIWEQSYLRDSIKRRARMISWHIHCSLSNVIYIFFVQTNFAPSL